MIMFSSSTMQQKKYFLTTTTSFTALLSKGGDGLLQAGSSLLGRSWWPTPLSQTISPVLVTRAQCITVSFTFTLLRRKDIQPSETGNVSDIGVTAPQFVPEAATPLHFAPLPSGPLGWAASQLCRTPQCLEDGGSVLLGLGVSCLSIGGQGCPFGVLLPHLCRGTAGSDVRPSSHGVLPVH